MKKNKKTKDAKGVFTSGFRGNSFFAAKVQKTSKAIATRLKILDIADLSNGEFRFPKDYSGLKEQK